MMSSEAFNRYLDQQSNHEYGVGSVIVYNTFGGQARKVTVTLRDENIKNGRAGFDGTTADGQSVWGYDDQITRVLEGA